MKSVILAEAAQDLISSLQPVATIHHFDEASEIAYENLKKVFNFALETAATLCDAEFSKGALEIPTSADPSFAKGYTIEAQILAKLIRSRLFDHNSQGDK